MDADRFLSSPAWRDLRERVLARDSGRCTVGRWLGGACLGDLHVNHIVPRSERPDLALDETNCGTVCARHHPSWEAFARALRLATRAELPRCSHRHPYASGRRACEERRRRRMLDRRLARLAA